MQDHRSSRRRPFPDEVDVSYCVKIIHDFNNKGVRPNDWAREYCSSYTTLEFLGSEDARANKFWFGYYFDDEQDAALFRLRWR